MPREILIKDTHRGLYYEDGVLVEVLGAGRHRLPLGRAKRSPWTTWFDPPQTDVILVDMRARELTIKGQEILTSDKVAVRVNILVQFNVTDAKAAIHAVENYEDRIYSDVQLAARRALAAMMLEEIMTNRNRLSEEILQDVQGAAREYGVAIRRADVKDLVFPGNLQEVMNRVLAAQRMSEAQLIEARTKAEVQRIEAQTKADAQRVQAQSDQDAARMQAQSCAEATRLAVEAELAALANRAKQADAYVNHPALLRLEELAALRSMAQNANARLYLGFPFPSSVKPGDRGATSTDD